MKTQEILKTIRENGGFHNFQNWDRKEIQTWVKNYFECSEYVAKNVSFTLNQQW